MERDPFEGQETFTLNIEQCMNDKSMPSVIRNVFKELNQFGYINTGKFFQDMSDLDVELLSDLAEATHPDADVTEEEAQRGYELMAILGMGLLVGEGKELTMQSSEDALRITIAYTAIEHLNRMGLVEVIHENWTMEMGGSEPIVRKKD